MSKKGKVQMLFGLVVLAIVLHCTFPNKNVSIIEQIRKTSDVNDVNDLDVNEPILVEGLADLAMKNFK